MSLNNLKNVANHFSVVIPAYNEANYIGATIKSLKSQTYSGNFEIIVVDNNSVDNTYKIAKAAGAKVIKEKNTGVCWARNSGSMLAKGDIIVSTDADTVFSENWLSNIDKRFQSDPRLVAVVGPCVFNNAPAWGRMYPKLQFGLVDFIFKTFGKTIHASATNMAFKKTAFIGYDTNLTQGGDELDLLKRLRQKGQIYFDIKNPTFTSSRRLTRGFIYNFFVTFLAYYIFEYFLSNIFKRPILGQAPKIRSNSKPHRLSFIKAGLALLIILIILVGVVKTRHIVFASPTHLNVLKNIFS